MATISVRRLDDETVKLLRIRAAQHGVSMEEEVRRILRQAVAAPDRLGDLAQRRFGASDGVDLQLPEREAVEPVDLSR